MSPQRKQKTTKKNAGASAADCEDPLSKKKEDSASFYRKLSSLSNGVKNKEAIKTLVTLRSLQSLDVSGNPQSASKPRLPESSALVVKEAAEAADHASRLLHEYQSRVNDDIAKEEAALPPGAFPSRRYSSIEFKSRLVLEGRQTFHAFKQEQQDEKQDLPKQNSKKKISLLAGTPKKAKHAVPRDDLSDLVKTEETEAIREKVINKATNFKRVPSGSHIVSRQNTEEVKLGNNGAIVIRRSSYPVSPTKNFGKADNSKYADAHKSNPPKYEPAGFTGDDSGVPQAAKIAAKSYNKHAKNEGLHPSLKKAIREQRAKQAHQPAPESDGESRKTSNIHREQPNASENATSPKQKNLGQERAEKKQKLGISSKNQPKARQKDKKATSTSIAPQRKLAKAKVAAKRNTVDTILSSTRPKKTQSNSGSSKMGSSLGTIQHKKMAVFDFRERDKKRHILVGCYPDRLQTMRRITGAGRRYSAPEVLSESEGESDIDIFSQHMISESSSEPLTPPKLSPRPIMEAPRLSISSNFKTMIYIAANLDSSANSLPSPPDDLSKLDWKSLSRLFDGLEIDPSHILNWLISLQFPLVEALDANEDWLQRLFNLMGEQIKGSGVLRRPDYLLGIFSNKDAMMNIILNAGDDPFSQFNLKALNLLFMGVGMREPDEEYLKILQAKRDRALAEAEIYKEYLAVSVYNPYDFLPLKSLGQGLDADMGTSTIMSLHHLLSGGTYYRSRCHDFRGGISQMSCYDSSCGLLRCKSWRCTSYNSECSCGDFGGDEETQELIGRRQSQSMHFPKCRQPLPVLVVGVTRKECIKYDRAMQSAIMQNEQWPAMVNLNDVISGAIPAEKVGRFDRLREFAKKGGNVESLTMAARNKE